MPDNVPIVATLLMFTSEALDYVTLAMALRKTLQYTSTTTLEMSTPPKGTIISMFGSSFHRVTTKYEGS